MTVKDGLKTSNSYPYMAPRSIDDVFSQDFLIWLRQVAEYQVLTALVSTAGFPSIEEEDGAFDRIETPQDFALIDPSEEAIVTAN